MAKQVDYKAVGLRIKTLRLKNNIYQTELAKNIGVSQTHMSNIESGRAGLTLENLVKMTNIFNCGIDDIVFGEEKAKKETQTTSLENFTMQDIVQALQMLKTCDTCKCGMRSKRKLCGLGIPTALQVLGLVPTGLLIP